MPGHRSVLCLNLEQTLRNVSSCFAVSKTAIENSFGTLAFCCSFCCILKVFRFTALGWYFDRVLPKEYGVRLSPTFLFRRSFWQSVWRLIDKPVDLRNLRVWHRSRVQTIHQLNLQRTMVARDRNLPVQPSMLTQLLQQKKQR